MTKSELRRYCAERRHDAFNRAKQALQLARESINQSGPGHYYSKSDWLEVVKFWRNDAAYYIRKPSAATFHAEA